jgi:hypothetical protein
MGAKQSLETKKNIDRIHLKLIEPKMEFKFQKKFVFNEEIFYFYTPCQKISSSEFVIEVRRESQDNFDSIENYHLHIGLADLTDYQRDGENLIEYKKEFKSITIIVRYDQNMFIKEIIYKYKFDYNIKSD